MMQQEGRHSQQEDFWEEHVAAMHGQDGAIQFSRTAGLSMRKAQVRAPLQPLGMPFQRTLLTCAPEQ